MINVIEINFKWNGGFTQRSSTSQIILHHADAITCTVEDIHRWHLNNGWTGIGYHYFVKKDGTIYRGRPENVVGAHAIGANTNSIGICAEGNYEIETMPEVQKNAIKELIADIKSRYGNLEIKGHKEVSNTSCPGKNYPLEELKNPTQQNTNVVEKKEEFEMAKTYRNGSTPEKVYADTNCSKLTGSLDRYEVCECLGIVNSRYIVKYKVNGTNNYKVGFVKYNGGIK